LLLVSHNHPPSNPCLVELAERSAAGDGITLQCFASVGILTDSTYLQLEGAGTASMDIGFSCRYTHTPTEVADVRDIHRLGRLLAAMIDRVDRNFPLYHY
jgi:putative aminopeptidase FrvX